MTAVDTSVVVPVLLSWHEHHASCREAAGGARIPAHALVETYSVLTRLPSPHRVSGDVAQRLLAGWFPLDAVLVTPAAVQRSAVRRLAAAGMEGGAIYDAVIALTAHAHRQALLTRDQRALRCYAQLGVEAELLGG